MSFNIYGIAKNYRDHVSEMQRMEQAAGVQVAAPSNPVFFMKPTSALLDASGIEVEFPYPSCSHDVHHEVELVVRIGRKASHVEADEAMRCIDGVALGIDFTARDVQTALKGKGHPWLLGKGFDNSALVGPMLDAKGFADLQAVDFGLKVDGAEVQHGNTRQMIHPIGKQISFLSQYITLGEGDLIFTGTPSGVGPVQRGGLLEGILEGKTMFRCRVV